MTTCYPAVIGRLRPSRKAAPQRGNARGHDAKGHSMAQANRSAYDKARNTTGGLCECGCQRLAPIVKSNDASKGLVKGEPYRFVKGHALSSKWTPIEPGDRFGQLVAAEHRERRMLHLRVVCDCGQEMTVKIGNLLTGNTTSCGHWKQDISAGERFGRLVTLEARRPYRSVACLCDCGNRTAVAPQHLLSGATKSCGCYQREEARERETIHGMSHTTEHNIWLGMHQRCFNSKYPKFRYWGGRGITICQGWREFTVFYADMGPRPAGLTIDRVDNNGNYSCGHCEECIANDWPMNCRWATRKQQRANRRDSK